MFPSSTLSGGGGTSVTSDNVSMSPTFSDSVFSDIDVDSRSTRGPRALPGNSLPMDSNRLFVPIKKKRAPSPPGSSPDRGSDSGGYASSSSNRNRLVDFDLDPRPMSATEPYNRTVSEMENLSLASNNAGSYDTGARPKTQIITKQTSSKSDKKNRKNVSNLKLKENFSDIQNGLYMAAENRPLSKDSGVGSTQYIDSVESGDVKLSEQQNVNVDETRLSAALSLFDPLTQDDNTMASGDLLEGATSPPGGHAFQNFSNSNFQQNSANEPLISISNDNDSSQFKFDLPASDGKGKDVSSACDMYLQSDRQTKRRGSSDSNRSSGSSLSKDDGDRSSLDNNQHRVDEKVQQMLI